ncbi:T9SS type A sorting domain-containing protein [Reichenbachiella ulvae]|uniref:T9SS type A sorting domain-containing protein n=1 Tax=Reichenbachiella ulvae TaxID=2980104 RepID=A0ABT3CYC7_9BACT|nr:T9SS type A sorting domain-containing protein [Reichenbachiella ulvae]MCV9388576.1 T9SS type A sorting domain-containing protein [Reichenbachiella ulvae]
MRKIIVAALLYLVNYASFGQCPTSGTISSDCTTTGNLTVSGGTLTIASGVTVTITGTLSINNGGKIDAASDAIINANQLTEGYGTTNEIFGGTINIATNFTIAGGGPFNMDGTILTVAGAISIAGTNIEIHNSTIQSASLETNHNSWIITNSTFTTTGTGEFELEDATISNSTFNIGGMLDIAGGTNTASGSTFNVGQGFAVDTGVDALTMNGGGSLEITNGSTMYINGDVVNNELYIDGSDVEITGDFDNAGAEIVEVRNGGSIKVGGDYNNSGSGSTTADGGGTIIIEGDYNNAGGGSTTVNDGGFSVGGSYTGGAPTGTGSTGDCSSGGGGCCGSACSTLPVSLVGFKVERVESGIVIKWTTSSEINNDRFIVYRSGNNQVFEVIKVLIGHGNSNETQYYEVTDYPERAGMYYYRLEQVDFDGQNEIFPTKRIHFNPNKDKQKLDVYPVPLSSNQNIQLDYQESNEEVNAQIFDLSGNLKHEVEIERQGQKITYKTENLALKSGIYILRTQIGVDSFSQKIHLN